MSLLRKLAVGSTLATIALVTIGGLVRATKSGLGCGTNWPHCPGDLTRPLVIEFTHRATAGALVVLIALLAVAAFRHRRDHPRLLWPSLGALVLVVAQALLGAIVVKLELEAASVVLHLATAMALLALLVYVSALALSTDHTAMTSDPSTAKRASIAAGAVLMLLLVGSYVSGIGAGRAFPDWPLMDGRVVPDLSISVNAVHFLHRVLAIVAGAAVVWACVPAVRTTGIRARLAAGTLAMFVVEIAIGAGNVFTDLNPVLVTGHLLVGSLVWVGLVALAVTARAVPIEAASKYRVESPPAVLQSSR